MLGLVHDGCSVPASMIDLAFACYALLSMSVTLPFASDFTHVISLQSHAISHLAKIALVLRCAGCYSGRSSLSQVGGECIQVHATQRHWKLAGCHAHRAHPLARLPPFTSQPPQQVGHIAVPCSAQISHIKKTMSALLKCRGTHYCVCTEARLLCLYRGTATPHSRGCPLQKSHTVACIISCHLSVHVM